MDAEDPWSSAAPLPEITDIDRERFEREVVPAGRPVVLRGLIADWPAVAAARQSDEALAIYLSPFASTDPVPIWVAPAELGGRYDFADDFTALNHQRQTLPMAELLRIPLAARADDDAAPHAAPRPPDAARPAATREKGVARAVRPLSVR